MNDDCESQDARWRAARDAYKRKDYNRCRDIATQIANDPHANLERRVLALHLSGDCLLDEERYREAIEIYDRLLALRPDDIGHANRGFALMELGRFAEALSSYSDALSMNDGNLIAAKFAGFCLLDLGRAQEALHLVEPRIARNPEYAAFYRIKGEALLLLRVFGLAYEAFCRAVEFDPNDALSSKAKRKLEAAAATEVDDQTA